MSSEVGLLVPASFTKLRLIMKGMPDFVYSTTSSSFANRFREQILSNDCENIVIAQLARLLLTSSS